ncbi:MAG: DUF4268 domain-containing protein [Christensenellales bacterium]
MKRIEKNEQAEQELNIWCNTLYNYTKQMAENPTRANKWIFDKASHDEWILSKFPKHLSSVKAYNLFYELTGQDIREFNWLSTTKTKQGEKIIIHQHFVDEHLTTAYDFKNTLLHYYNQGKLTIDLIKDLITQQRLCWITKQENKELNARGYIKHRNNPLDAYKECGIEIYNAENEDLENIMKPEFGTKSNKDKKYNIANNNLEIRTEFFNQLKKYFDEHSYNNRTISLVFKNENEYAYIYNRKEVMINTRVKDGTLNDICVFLSGDDAKRVFDELKTKREEIELLLGYRLVWDRNDKKKASRIGRFGQYSSSPNKYGLCNEEEVIIGDNIKPFDFDLDVEKVANELIRFYEVFMPRIRNIKDRMFDYKMQQKIK